MRFCFRPQAPSFALATLLVLFLAVGATAQTHDPGEQGAGTATENATRPAQGEYPATAGETAPSQKTPSADAEKAAKEAAKDAAEEIAEEAAKDAAAEVADDATKSAPVRKALGALLTSLAKNNEALDELQASLDATKDSEEKAPLQERIDSLRQTIAEQQADLTEIASGISQETFAKPQPISFDLKAELAELLAPLVQQMKDLTERPREIEQLRSEIRRRTEIVEKAKQGIKRLDELIIEAKNPQLIEYLQTERDRWISLIQDYQNALDLAKVQLTQTLSENESITESVSTLFKDFFSSRGLNLILAVLIFLSIFFVMRFSQQKLSSSLFKNKAGETRFSARLVSIAFGVLSMTLALIGALAVFYIAGDWVLLGVTIILILGLIWSAKASISKYWEHVKLLLNVGGVREGERLVWNGVPYRVDTIRYYTTLTNPELSGGRIRVGIDELMGKFSRPFASAEPFFPSKRNDYVVVGSDFGKVLRQTPDFVQLELLSGAIKYLNTASYIASDPLNLATGYTVTVTFGVDYKHQDIATTVIPETLQKNITAAFAQTNIAEHVNGVSCSFKEAADSSLNMAIFVSLGHGAATWYYAAGRLVQRTAVETCSENGWEIPFPQLTVHSKVRN